MGTDQAWEKWGSQNPYFGVITDEKYRNENISAASKEEFFLSGTHHVEHVLNVCRQHFDPDFSPQRVLDFGCGTGRLVIPFASLASEVVGLDVSPSMLAEARRNCEERQLENVQLLQSTDDITSSIGEFDLIHSFIVFQHIPVSRGIHIFKNILSRLRPGGLAAIHLTYSKTAFERYQGVDPYRTRPIAARIRKLGRGLERILRRTIRRLPPDPEMQMNTYDANAFLFLLQQDGIDDVFIEFTNHTGTLGSILFFQRPTA